MSGRAAIVVALSAVAAPAVASPRDGERDRAHDFHALDRLTPETSFFADLGYVFMGKSDAPRLDLSDAIVVRFDLGGAFVSPKGFGGYLFAPMAIAREPTGNVGPFVFTGRGDTALGNLELGGLYVAKTPSVDVLLRAGLALPTADDSGVGGNFIGYAAAARLGDLVDVWPNATWLRVSASPTARSGRGFFRADLGVDVALATQDDYARLDPAVRFGAGGGVDLGDTDVTAELVVLSVHDPLRDRRDTWAELTLGARVKLGGALPGLALHVPIGVESPYDAAKAALVASLTVRL